MNATTAELLDSGNLQLTFGKDILWQSFDHPSDTLLPGLKLSINKRTGQETHLTSWAAHDDPQPGIFCIGIDPKVPRQLITWKENVPYWRSAVYFGKEATTFFRNRSGSFFYVAYNFDADEIYFTFGVSDSSVKLRSVLNPDGLFNLLLWQDYTSTWSEFWGEPLNKCYFYAQCGPYGACDKNIDPLSGSQCKCLKGFRTKFQKQWAMGTWPGGCVREKELTCGKGERFSKFERMKLPDHSVLLGNKSTKECEFECLKNCSCTAYAYANVTEGSITSCLTWFGDLMDLVENHGLGQTIFIRVHHSDQGETGHAARRSLVIAIVSATAGLLTIIFGYFLWNKTLTSNNKTETGAIGGSISESISNVSAGGRNSDMELPLFSLSSILAASNNFSEANKLGEGGFGPVYKGILPENEEVAMKRLSKKSGQGHEEFMNELKLIAKLQHTNLVRLLGCCNEEKEMVLIYDGYMSPEYALYGHFSEKLDVFSFGVLLLEILSGKKNAAFYRCDYPLTLAGWAWELWKEGRGMEVIDESNLQLNRPTMSSVVFMLSNEATSLPPMKEPAYLTHRNSSAVGSSSQTSTSFSINVVTISMPEAR
ncbi:G-type lectin S-receptor-like serine/threonine-protein kinase [Prunus yedoensis var. nudiflora]|uniref:non-specific serine/threonine protein kinase n=1 Tax=Prunus yedoensis var. nudiflora TaxID=2094558 RepID=A0A314YBQ1_PRUYE|nr:G-type lectin S-receptor-like serine/threonine-protein kinase [Prunus yedoensis var. nudiflora]